MIHNINCNEEELALLDMKASSKIITKREGFGKRNYGNQKRLI